MNHPETCCIHNAVFLPIAFAARESGASSKALFAAKTPGGEFRFFRDRISFHFEKEGNSGAPLELLFCGAQKETSLRGEGERRGRLNYVLGGYAEDWHPGLAVYEKLKYEGLWQGVDLELFGDAYGLKFVWSLQKAEDVLSILLCWEGAEALALSGDGSLLIRHPHGIWADAAPRAWQDAANGRKKVCCAYRLLGENAFGFELSGNWERGAPLTIDPMLTLSAL